MEREFAWPLHCWTRITRAGVPSRSLRFGVSIRLRVIPPGLPTCWLESPLSA